MKRNGFSLVELAIALVIIGLLIGGILVARSMISATKLQNLVRTIQQYEIVTQNFETKYNGEIPGDSTSFSPPGDGDGKVYQDMHMYQNTGGLQESLNFWLHLNQAGLLSQQYTGDDYPAKGYPNFDGNFQGYVPKLNYGTNCYLNAFTDSNGEPFGNYWAISGGAPQSLTACMTAEEALELDAKLDDGLPGSGNIVEMYPYSGPYVAPGDHLGCDNNNSTQYNITGNWGVSISTPSCLLAIKAQW